MSDSASPDRRRVARAVITDTELSVLTLPIPVRLLDISKSGALFETANAVEVGTRGTLRFNFGGSPFSADVKVQRLEPSPTDPAGRYRIGVAFVALSRDDQQVIQRFADQ
jgi:hypothetical protein